MLAWPAFVVVPSVSGAPSLMVRPPTAVVEAAAAWVVMLASVNADVVTGSPAVVVRALVIGALPAALPIASVVVNEDAVVRVDESALVCVFSPATSVMVFVAMAFVVAAGGVVAVLPLLRWFATVDTPVVASAPGATVVVWSAPTVVPSCPFTPVAVFALGSTGVAPLLPLEVVGATMLAESGMPFGVAVVAGVVAVVDVGVVVGSVL